jgi:hypothetical protein
MVLITMIIMFGSGMPILVRLLPCGSLATAVPQPPHGDAVPAAPLQHCSCLVCLDLRGRSTHQPFPPRPLQYFFCLAYLLLLDICDRTVLVKLCKTPVRYGPQLPQLLLSESPAPRLPPCPTQQPPHQTQPQHEHIASLPTLSR